MRRRMSGAEAASRSSKRIRGGPGVRGTGGRGNAGARTGLLAMLLLLASVPAQAEGPAYRAGAGGIAPAAQARQAPAPSSDTVAVVAFANITGAEEDAWIGFGIAETITADLAGLGAVAVMGNDAVQAALRGVGVDPGAAVDLSDTPAVQAGRALGARWVVSGGFQRLGQQVRLTARIVDVATAAVQHATTVDGMLVDLFDLQDRLSVDLRRGLLQSPPAMAANVQSPGVAPSPPMRRPAPPRDPLRGDVPVAEGGRPPFVPPGGGTAAGTGRRPPFAPPDGGAAAGTGRRSPFAPPGGDGAAAAGRRPPFGGPSNPGAAAGRPAGLAAGAPRVVGGPPAPVAPETLARDAAGRVTIRAVPIDGPLDIDGVLDEGVYEIVQPLTGFVQQQPDEGAPATERTEAWVFYDDRSIYVSARNWDSAPESRWVANEMQRDSFQIIQNDSFSVALDTFYDRRNGFAFMVNPIGGFFDYQITDEGNPNLDWNPIWDVTTGRFAGGWTVEMEIPFKSIRFPGGESQVWGIQLGRNVRWKNEWNYITPVAISAGPGMFRLSAAATLAGLDVPSGNRTFEIKPYGIGSSATDVNSDLYNEGDFEYGVDVKYGVTENLTADFTYNTDFAQVEVDEAQVNLTRFSLFFPEKREFFLEGRGIFDFGRGVQFGGGGGPGGIGRPGSGGFMGGGDVPTVFFSRRIGLESGQTVPIQVGGRMTGKVGDFTLGALNIQTDEPEQRTTSTRCRPTSPPSG